jgi:hypothetical protein
MNSFERLENLLIEDKVSQQGVSLQKVQDLMLKIAKLESKLADAERLLNACKSALRSRQYGNGSNYE